MVQIKLFMMPCKVIVLFSTDKIGKKCSLYMSSLTKRLGVILVKPPKDSPIPGLELTLKTCRPI